MGYKDNTSDNTSDNMPDNMSDNMSDNTSEQYSYARSVKWQDKALYWNSPYPVCQGYYRHGICVYGIGDLGWLLNQETLFANKFDAEKEDLVIQCLEQWLKIKELEEMECRHLFLS